MAMKFLVLWNIELVAAVRGDGAGDRPDAGVRQPTSSAGAR